MAAAWLQRCLAIRSTTVNNRRKSVDMQKEIVMRRMSVQGLVALILVGTLTISQAAGPAIGVAMANGSFQVDSFQVYGNTTLFDGTRIQTEKAPSRLQLKNGAKMGLGED